MFKDIRLKPASWGYNVPHEASHPPGIERPDNPLRRSLPVNCCDVGPKPVGVRPLFAHPLARVGSVVKFRCYQFLRQYAIPSKNHIDREVLTNWTGSGVSHAMELPLLPIAFNPWLHLADVYPAIGPNKSDIMDLLFTIRSAANRLGFRRPCAFTPCLVACCRDGRDAASMARKIPPPPPQATSPGPRPVPHLRLRSSRHARPLPRMRQNR